MTVFSELNSLFFKLPKITNPIEIKIKKKHITISLLEFLRKNKAGKVNKEIQIKLKEYVPITDKI